MPPRKSAATKTASAPRGVTAANKSVSVKLEPGSKADSRANTKGDAPSSNSLAGTAPGSASLTPSPSIDNIATTKKRKADDDIVYDRSDWTKPFPLGMRLFCRHYTEAYLGVVILDRRKLDEHGKVVPDPELKSELQKQKEKHAARMKKRKKKLDEGKDDGAAAADGESKDAKMDDEDDDEDDEDVKPKNKSANAAAVTTPSSSSSTEKPMTIAQWGAPHRRKKKENDIYSYIAENPYVLIDDNHVLPMPDEYLHNHWYQYYVHYMQWDRRMDEWVDREKLKLAEYVVLTHLPVDGRALLDVQADKYDASMEKSKTQNSVVTQRFKGKAMRILEEQAANDHNHQSHGNMTEDDVKAHEEATKVKNIAKITLGKHEIDTWYYSPFPAEYDEFEVLHFCEFCLTFFGHIEELQRHIKKCTVQHPPGNEIYRAKETNVNIAVFELDGQKETVYCENLCYLAKLFLDHKTLEYDCSPFLFYVICEHDERGYHPVGYFSKEKVSMMQYNLACILTLPCHQKKGYGKFLISLSYELSKLEEKVGSPEKPISDLGLKAYIGYWSGTLLKLLETRTEGNEFSIEELSEQTRITCDDIIDTLKDLKILVWYQGKWVYSYTRLQTVLMEFNTMAAKTEAKIKEETRTNSEKVFVQPCRPELLHWNPYFAKRNIEKGEAAARASGGGYGGYGGNRGSIYDTPQDLTPEEEDD